MAISQMKTVTSSWRSSIEKNSNPDKLKTKKYSLTELEQHTEMNYKNLCNYPAKLRLKPTRKIFPTDWNNATDVIFFIRCVVSIRWEKLALFVKIFGSQNLSHPLTCHSEESCFALAPCSRWKRSRYSGMTASFYTFQVTCHAGSILFISSTVFDIKQDPYGMTR